MMTVSFQPQPQFSGRFPRLGLKRTVEATADTASSVAQAVVPRGRHRRTTLWDTLVQALRPKSTPTAEASAPVIIHAPAADATSLPHRVKGASGHVPRDVPAEVSLAADATSLPRRVKASSGHVPRDVPAEVPSEPKRTISPRRLYTDDSVGALERKRRLRENVATISRIRETGLYRGDDGAEAITRIYQGLNATVPGPRPPSRRAKVLVDA